MPLNVRCLRELKQTALHYLEQLFEQKDARIVGFETKMQNKITVGKMTTAGERLAIANGRRRLAKKNNVSNDSKGSRIYSNCKGLISLYY